MKRVFVAILSFFYLSTAIGANVYFHYCMDEFAGWSLWHSDNNSACGNCGMDKNESEAKGCCKDDVKQVKLETDQKSFAVYSFEYLLPDALPAQHSPLLISFNDHLLHRSFCANAPPHAGTPFYLLHRVLRI